MVKKTWRRPSFYQGGLLIVLMSWFGLIAEGGTFPAPDQLPEHVEFPNPMVALDGTKVTSTQQWEQTRRPELKKLFENYMYGKYPEKGTPVQGRVLFEDTQAFHGKGTLSEVEIVFGPPDWPKIYLLVALPNPAEASLPPPKVPCFVGTNFGGNHCLSDDARIRVPTVWVPERQPGVKNNRASAAGRGAQKDIWPLAHVVGAGYGVACFYCGDIQPDRPFVREGMRATLPVTNEKVSDNREPGDTTATIMWWAWGIHRAVDYLLTHPRVDGRRLAVVGHSRLGKTALLAGAFDERIALVIPNQAGCGGTGPSRHRDARAESVQRINTAFPHWFCGNFKAFNQSTQKLPFDQNGLIALCAPRPVLVTNAAEDLWANPAGQFAVLKAAEPAYRLYEPNLDTLEKLPAPNAPVARVRLGYWIRPGKHSMTQPDWDTYITFANYWWK